MAAAKKGERVNQDDLFSQLSSCRAIQLDLYDIHAKQTDLLRQSQQRVQDLQDHVLDLESDLRVERHANDRLQAHHEDLKNMLKKTYGQVVEDYLTATQLLHEKDQQLRALEAVGLSPAPSPSPLEQGKQTRPQLETSSSASSPAGAAAAVAQRAAMPATATGGHFVGPKAVDLDANSPDLPSSSSAAVRGAAQASNPRSRSDSWFHDFAAGASPPSWSAAGLHDQVEPCAAAGPSPPLPSGVGEPADGGGEESGSGWVGWVPPELEEPLSLPEWPLTASSFHDPLHGGAAAAQCDTDSGGVFDGAQNPPAPSLVVPQPRMFPAARLVRLKSQQLAKDSAPRGEPVSPSAKGGVLRRALGHAQRTGSGMLAERAKPGILDFFHTGDGVPAAAVASVGLAEKHFQDTDVLRQDGSPTGYHVNASPGAAASPEDPILDRSGLASAARFQPVSTGSMGSSESARAESPWSMPLSYSGSGAGNRENAAGAAATVTATAAATETGATEPLLWQLPAAAARRTPGVASCSRSPSFRQCADVLPGAAASSAGAGERSAYFSAPAPVVMAPSVAPSAGKPQVVAAKPQVVVAKPHSDIELEIRRRIESGGSLAAAAERRSASDTAAAAAASSAAAAAAVAESMGGFDGAWDVRPQPDAAQPGGWYGVYVTQEQFQAELVGMSGSEGEEEEVGPEGSNDLIESIKGQLEGLQAALGSGGPARTNKHHRDGDMNRQDQRPAATAGKHFWQQQPRRQPQHTHGDQPLTQNRQHGDAVAAAAALASGCAPPLHAVAQATSGIGSSCRTADSQLHRSTAAPGVAAAAAAASYLGFCGSPGRPVRGGGSDALPADQQQPGISSVARPLFGRRGSDADPLFDDRDQLLPADSNAAPTARQAVKTAGSHASLSSSRLYTAPASARSRTSAADTAAAAAAAASAPRAFMVVGAGLRN